MENIEDQDKKSFHELRAQVDPEVYEKWDCEQIYVRGLITEEDIFEWKLDPKSDKALKYIGGVDISFSQKYQDIAVAILVVIEYPSLKKVHEEFEIVKLDGPYIPGFLAFREAAHLVKLFKKLQINKPQFTPQVIMVDGNGILHQNACGLASHLGVLIDKPTIGVGKTIFYVDGLRKDVVLDKFKKVTDEGGFAVLQGDSGRVWGAAYKSKKDVIDPIIVSVGHKITLQSGLDLISKCCNFRIPEPVRVADIRSRELVKKITLQEALTAPTNTLEFLTEKFDEEKKKKVMEKKNLVFKLKEEDFPSLF
ncbi:hypothetical protein ABPG72_006903 [Tetrahymena utriculariae]